jgi:hypothetical protein
MLHHEGEARKHGQAEKTGEDQLHGGTSRRASTLGEHGARP